ncbi:MAG: glycosyltransferase family 2 protein [Chthoniobacterales bacterium]
MPQPVSIVTVSYDTLFFVRLLVEKVREFVGERAYEIIAVDRGSGDGTLEWLSAQPDVRILIEPLDNRRHSHGEAAEAGARSATHENIVLLDSDAHPVAPEWLELTMDRLNAHDRLAGAVFHGEHEGNPNGWYIHPHFMAFRRGDLDRYIVLRKIRRNFDTGEEATLNVLNAGLGVVGYPLVFCERFSVGHPHFPTEAAGVFHAWYGTRLSKEIRTVGRETGGAVTDQNYREPLKQRLREAYRLDY